MLATPISPELKMSEEVKVGSRVLVKDKHLEGTVKFSGTATFAPGKWIGVELDEPKGKNNGIVQGKAYFHCADNCGLMVRQGQLQVIPEVKTFLQSPRISGHAHTSGIPISSKRPSSAGKKLSPQGQQTSPKPSKLGILSKLLIPGLGLGSQSRRLQQPELSDKSFTSSDTSLSVEEETTQPAMVAPAGANAADEDGDGVDMVSGEVGGGSDISQRLSSLQAKRAEDKARIKELEKYRAQYMQMTEYKQKWSEFQSDLQQQLKVSKKEVREHQLAREMAEEEMRDLLDTVEMATLDKEMAEERSESLQVEVDALKEKVEELTIDLEIIRQEISDGGVEGAAANAQYKQLEQQNSRLKEALVRLRDLSAQDKLDQQRVMKDLEKTGSQLTQVKDQKDKIAQELLEADSIIDELKDQVDAALGAEEMVEKLTDTNLELEERIEVLTETVTDLEALRDLSEEQEELRMEVEHDLREELDMKLNSIRQLELKLEASQETIVDQHQTVEQFRGLVHRLKMDLAEKRSVENTVGRGEEKEVDGRDSKTDLVNINVQVKSAIKEQSRTIDFELRKLDALQASKHIKLLISFMPNSFLVSGGEYDALLVLMLLPRMIFKVELIIDQLKQQYKYEDMMGSLSTLTSAQIDQLVFVSSLIFKLISLHMLVCHVHGILKECDVQLYRQMGSVRDDLTIHEKALDILIGLLKDQLNESVPLHGLDKAISHFESLLEGRLRQDGEGKDGNVSGRSSNLLNQMRVVSCGCDVTTLQLMRLQAIAPDGSDTVVQFKEMDTFNSDLRHSSRKIRRKIPAAESNRILLYDLTVAQDLVNVLRRQLVLTETFKALHKKASQKASTLTEGEKLMASEFDEFIGHVIASGTLQEVRSEVSSSEQQQVPKEMLRKALSISSASLEHFLSELSEGRYDSPSPKQKLEPPVVLRAHSVKAELSDIEGLGFRLEERQQDILQLKKSLKLKAKELSEANVKIGLLEKKMDSMDAEIARKVGVEKEEIKKMQGLMEKRSEQFAHTIAILQGDIDNMENERENFEKKLDHDTTRKGPLADLKHVSRIRTLGGPSSPYSGSSSTSQYVGRVGVAASAAATEAIGGDSGTDESMAQGVEPNPLLLSRIESLNKALGFSIDENFRLKAKIAKAQLNSLAPLKVPQRLVMRRSSSSLKGEVGSGSNAGNQTDQEKHVLKRATGLIADLKQMCLRGVVPLPPKKPCLQSETDDIALPKATPICSSREQLSNSMVEIFEMQRRVKELREVACKVLRSQYPGGAVTTSLASFISPQFSKVLCELSQSSAPTACLRLHPPSSQTTCAAVRRRVVLSPAQFLSLHKAIVS